MATFTERLELIIGATSSAAVSELNKTAGAAEELTAKQKAMTLVSTGAKNALTSLGIPAEAAGTALKFAAVGAGAVAAVKVVDWAHDAAGAFASVTGEVRAFQRVAGTSAEDSSRLVFAVKELGIQPDAAAMAFGRFATRLGNNKDLLDKYGVSVAHNRDGTVDMASTVSNVAQAMQQTDDATQKAAIANAAFGRSWQTLSPLLSKSKADLADIFAFADTTHQVFSPQQLEAGRQFTVATRELHSALEGLKIEVGAAVAPVFTKLTTGLTDTLTALDKGASAVGGFGAITSSVVDAVNPFNQAMHGVSAATDLFNGHFHDAIDNFAQAIPGVGNALSAIDDLSGGFIFGGDHAETYKDKTHDVGAALQKVADLSVQGKQGTKEYSDAVKEAQSASDAYSKTQTDVAQSLQSVVQQQAAALDQQVALANAQLNVQGSLLNVKQALKDEAQAQHDANDAAQVGVDNSDQVQAAHLKTEAAIQAVIKAAQDRAVQQLGPGANGDDVAKAKIDATTGAIQYLGATTPATTQAIKDLGYSVITLPNGKQIVVTADTAQAVGALNAVKDAAKGVADAAVNAARQLAGAPGVKASSVTASPTQRFAAPAAALSPMTAMVAPMALAAAPQQAVVQAAPTFVVNVTAAGLGADAPEIQRAVVEAIRGYVDRNGRLTGLT